MSKTVKVDRIRITVGNKTIDLTPDELKELRDVLDATFGKETVFAPYSPIVIERPAWPRWPYHHWCQPTYISTGGYPSKGSSNAGEVKPKEYQTLCLSTESTGGSYA